MGTVSVYAPTKEAWNEVAPNWAIPTWELFLEQLRTWCELEGIPLHLDDAGYRGRTI